MLSNNSFKNIKRQLHQLGFTSYTEFLTSNLWKEFKNQLKKTYDCSYCRFCKSDNKELHFHHLSYKSSLLNPKNITICCKDCHKDEHKNIVIRRIRKEYKLF